jgi:hypothetical protein
MPKVYVLNQSAANVFECVVHFATTAGNNSAGTPWQTCYLHATKLGMGIGGTPDKTTGAPTSVLPQSGNNTPGKGEIGNTELAQITSGALIEQRFQAGIEPADVANPDPKLNLFADRKIAAFQAEFGERFKYYGYTVA